MANLPVPMTELLFLDRAVFEREYRTCIHDYLHANLADYEALAILRRSEELSARFAAVVGAEEATRVTGQLLERVASVFLPAPLPKAG